MSGADTGWAAAMPELCSDRSFRLGSALVASLLGHVLLLCWPLPLSTGGEPGAARPAVSTLRVSLNLIPESNANPAREDSSPARPAEPPAVTAGPDKTKDAPPGEQGTQDAIPLHGYYPAARLSRMPVAISTFDIQPPAGGDTGIGGKMTIRIWISAKGGIDSLRVLASGLPAAYAEAALAAFEKMRFEPGEINGVQVQSWVDIVIEYADFRREAAQPPAGSQ
jgi:TonB family protein